jgi:hypothetical protein
MKRPPKRGRPAAPKPARREAPVPARQAAPKPARGEASKPPSRTPQEECEHLMNAVLPIAEQSLTDRREFYPFGATLSARGGVALLDAWMGAEHPPADDALAALEETFRDGAAKHRIKATALVVDVLLVPPGKRTQRDAIEVRLDHRDGYSVRIVFPYSFPARASGLDEGSVVLEEPFALQGEWKIFPR